VVWLTSQSLGLLVGGCLAIALLAAVGSRFALRALLPQSEREAAYAVAAPLLSPLGAAFAILAALTLANEAGYLSSAQGIVSNEAADASRLAWAATMPGVRPTPIQVGLRTYLRDTRLHEWHGANAAEGEDTPRSGLSPTLSESCGSKLPDPASGSPPAPSCSPPSTRSPMTVGPVSRPLRESHPRFT